MVFAGAKEVFGKSRQFQAGKMAKRQAEALAALKEQSQSEEAKEEAAKTQKVFDDYRTLRGPSLMELHTAEGGKGKKRRKENEKEREGDDPQERKAFDRDRVNNSLIYDLCLCSHFDTICMNFRI